MTMIPVEEIATHYRSAGLGFDRIELVHGSTYKDSSTCILIPTRGMIDSRVVQAWDGVIAPMNQKRAKFFARGHEVGIAYDTMIKNILANEELAKWKYVLTLEDDNIVPADAHIRLLESIEAGPFDAVGGLYFTKGDINMPMCYGDPDEYKRTGVLDFKPRDMRAFLNGANVVPCNGVAMGCTLYRMELFKQFPAPWFVTVADVIPDKGPQCFTQDLYACERWARSGKTFAVDTRVRVGHLDINTGTVY